MPAKATANAATPAMSRLSSGWITGISQNRAYWKAPCGLMISPAQQQGHLSAPDSSQKMPSVPEPSRSTSQGFSAQSDPQVLRDSSGPPVLPLQCADGIATIAASR